MTRISFVINFFINKTLKEIFREYYIIYNIIETKKYSVNKAFFEKKEYLIKK